MKRSGGNTIIYFMEIHELENPNREVKDSLFTKLFNDEKNALELYNAITASNEKNDVIVLKTLSDVFYRILKNDLAFLVGNKVIVFMEHQSSLNPNMAIRLLFYAASVYKGLIDNSALYSSKRALLPYPEFFVLYNGEEELADETTLKLSDSFERGGKSVDLELKVKVININVGHNEGMLERSEHLSGYAIMVGKIREYMEPVGGLSAEARCVVLGRAIRRALVYCEEHDILRDFIRENAVEVINMLTAEFDIRVAERVWKEEAMERGIEKGREEEKEKIVRNLLALGMNVEQIARVVELDIKEVRDLYL